MSEFQKRQIGTTGVEVTSIGLGTVPLSGFKTKVSYAEFEDVIGTAFRGGVRYFDCAPMYGFGKAEYYLGHALRELGVRNDVVISTKVGRVLKPVSRVKKVDTVYGIEWIDPLPFLDTYDYTYDGFMRSFEDSQHRLGVDYIDILLVHDLGQAWHGDNADTYWRQIRDSGYRALDELRRTGAVSAVGLGVNETESVVTVAREFAIDCALIAGRYTLLNQDPLLADFAELQERRVSVLAAGVFNSGILAAGTKGSGNTYDYQAASTPVLDKVKAIEAVCDKYGVDLASAAIDFVSMNPAVTTVVLGAQGVKEITQNLATASKKPPREFWINLKTAGILPQNAPVDPR
ncbi:aldo/keto reductase [Mesorhizobium sp. M0006]|uniref:aldo/keto reductase n=1 Tax=Mesorhizobium sp. M0006 TaxID=2956838 RepID=UPI003339820C